jgi:xanthine dehydrogenase iron-sulfur cluster and FAD-binding subunit A
MHPEAELVSGCTSEDFHPNQVFLKKTVIVQINWLKDLHSFEVYDNHVCIGGGMTIADVKLNLHAAAADLPGTCHN